MEAFLNNAGNLTIHEYAQMAQIKNTGSSCLRFVALS